LWEKICGQKAHKNFSGKFGEIRAKILRTPKICLFLHLCDKASAMSGTHAGVQRRMKDPNPKSLLVLAVFIQ